MQLQYVPTEEQVVDILTKPLFHVKFEYFWDKLGVVRKDLPRKREQKEEKALCCSGVVAQSRVGYVCLGLLAQKG